MSITPYKSLTRVTAPTVEPVTLTEAKSHCRVDIDDDDTYISTLITAAREYIEDLLDISIIEQTWDVRYDGLPHEVIELPRPPLGTSTITVTYLQASGTTAALTSGTDFRVDRYTTPGRIYPNYLGEWPTVLVDENAVTVRFHSGSPSPSDVKGYIKQLILVLVAHWYSTRSAVSVGGGAVMSIPHTFDALLAAAGWGRYSE